MWARNTGRFRGPGRGGWRPTATGGNEGTGMQQRSDQKVRGEDSVLRARLTRWGALALGAVMVCFFGVLTYVNCFWATYPNDNDLDEVGWIAAHLSFGRAESFANQGYPPGL